MNKANHVITEGGKPITIDGSPVLYHYELNYRDFKRITPGVAMRNRVPYAMAICDHAESLSGIAIYVRYGNEWFQSFRFHELLIVHLLNKTKR
jgi:hypothetical protein